MSASSKRNSQTSSPPVLFGGVYAGKRVFVTGHTGFKGAWLSEWLLTLGAKVTGYSLTPPTKPALFEQLDLRSRLKHIIGDIRDAAKLKKAVQQTQPDFIFHLAAQPLVRDSYRIPVETYETNVLGTIHVLEAARALRRSCTVVCVTTDKCYENREWVHGYREEDPLGGYDPYSSSKAAAEIAIASWRRSFFKNHPVKVASARAGNVIGGGDWASDRIVPDCMKALKLGKAIPVRNKWATRPWQHVLEPLGGYLWLAAKLSKSKDANPRLASAFNFGPNHDANRTVADLVCEVLKHWPGKWEDQTDPKAPHEAGLLQLSSDKANALLGWSPAWDFATAVQQTVLWYRRVLTARNTSHQIQDFTREQIAKYMASAETKNLAWAVQSD